MSSILSRLVNLAGNVTGTLVVANGGTGAVTLASNGVLYGAGTGAVTALPVNATATKEFLTQSNSAAPAWATIVGADVPVVVPGTTSGVVSASGLTGNTTGSAIAAGFVGEFINTTLAGVATASANTVVYDANTVTLQAGAWLISCHPNMKSTWVTGQGAGQVILAKGDGTVIAQQNWTPVVSSAATIAVGPVSFSYVVNISTSTVYKMGAQCNSASTASVIAIVANGASPIGSLATNSYFTALRVA